jgi:hypothetical protein
LAEKNFERNEEDVKLLRGKAEQESARSLEGFTLADGSRVQYVPGKGWQVVNTQQQQGMQDQAAIEELLRLTEDQRIRRQGLRDAEGNRQEDNNIAAALRRKYLASTEPSLEELRQQEAADDASRLTGFNDPAQQAAITTAMRQGATGSIPQIMDSFARQRSDALRTQAPSQMQRARARLQDTRAQNMQQLNPYMAMADRGNKMYDVGFGGTSAGKAATNLLPTATNQSSTGAGRLISAYSKSRVPQQQLNNAPNTANAEFTAGASNVVGNLFGSLF